MKQLFKCFLTLICMLPLAGCSDAPECWDDRAKKALTELLQEKYGWEKAKLSDIRETDSDFDSRTCVVTVEYESAFSGMGSLGMAFSQAMYGRKFTNGTEQVEYKVKVQQTEKHGKQALVEISAMEDESTNEINRYMNQFKHMRK
ncbi:MAG: hypothetical protein IKP24_01700 [Alphaproteobacteria bacterium]|nr:hypothetical protein [Alphaproteobacteria bacterium]